jgi:hypothetical protein
LKGLRALGCVADRVVVSGNKGRGVGVARFIEIDCQLNRFARMSTPERLRTKIKVMIGERIAIGL